MKARDIEKRLENRLPIFTNRFTREIGIDSIIPSGATATVTTSGSHGLAVNKTVLIAGASAPIAIDSLTRVGNIATIVTVTDHDLTERFFPTVLLSGFNESEFNGELALLRVPNRRTFTIEVGDAGPIAGSGTPLLNEPGSPFGYNGRVKVTSVPTTSTFTYELPQALTEDAAGNNLRAVLGARIYSAINNPRADHVFESKDLNNLPDGDLAAFVILGPVAASRDRHTGNDGVSSAGVSGDNRQQILQSFSVIVKQKVTKQVSGATARDNMEDIAHIIIANLVGWTPGSGFAVESGSKIRFLSHEPLDYSTAIYSHIFDFELLADISNEDLQIMPTNVAFRSISFSFTNENGVQELSASINLDDEPLD